jgi:hypothetical protein
MQTNRSAVSLESLPDVLLYSEELSLEIEEEQLEGQIISCLAAVPTLLPFGSKVGTEVSQTGTKVSQTDTEVSQTGTGFDRHTHRPSFRNLNTPFAKQAASKQQAVSRIKASGWRVVRGGGEPGWM